MVVRNKPPALGRQLDRCDVCGDKYHRDKLVLTQVEFLEGIAENRVYYPSYDSTYWTVDDATDVSSTTVGTYGNRCDNVRLSLDNDNNLTYINSPKVWSGNGTVRASLSTYTAETSDTTFSMQIGPHEQNTSPDMTVVVGICDSAGNNKNPVKTWTINTMTRVWANDDVSDLAATGLGESTVVGSTTYYAFYWYVQVTNDGYWWWDEAQRETGNTYGPPENFVRAYGSSVNNTSEQSMITSRKVCPNCRETVLSKTEKYGRTDEPPTADPVETWNQEF